MPPVHQFPRPSFEATPRYQHRQWQPIFGRKVFVNLKGLEKATNKAFETRHSIFFFGENDGHVKCLQQKKGCTTFEEVVNSGHKFANGCHREFHKGFNENVPRSYKFNLTKIMTSYREPTQKITLRSLVSRSTSLIIKHMGAESPPHTPRSLENPHGIK